MNLEYSEAEARECAELEGYLGELFALRLLDWYKAVRIGGVEFRPLTAQEARAAGYRETDPELRIARVHDGQVFEIEIDVTAWKLRKKVPVGGPE